MASSIVHLAITNELIKRHSFKNVNRLKFGSVIADAGYDGNSHMKISLPGGQKTYDFTSFRQMFEKKMYEDDLYLGYYLHLIQDIVFRHFVYDKYHWNPMIPGNIERLHRDYAIVNDYVIKKYRIENDLIIPEKFDEEVINKICSFDINGFTSKIDSYYIPIDEAPVFFFTRNMTDEFISEATQFCLEELRQFDKGQSGIDMYKYAWTRKK